MLTFPHHPHFLITHIPSIGIFHSRVILPPVALIIRPSSCITQHHPASPSSSPVAVSHHPSPSHTIILPSSPSQHASVTLHIHQLRLQSSSPASLSSSLPNHPPPSPIFPLSCRRCGVQDNWLYWECLCESVWGISC